MHENVFKIEQVSTCSAVWETELIPGITKLKGESTN